MAETRFQEALQGMAARMPRVVREHEVLRISADIGGKDGMKAAAAARREALIWAQKRVGGLLPQQAWDGSDFDHLVGGRNCSGVRIAADASDLWGIRVEDPDKTVAGRNWTTEITIGLLGRRMPKLGVRLLASTPEDTLDITHHAPGVVQQLSDKCGLYEGSYELSAEPWHIESTDEAEQLVAMMGDQNRRLPLFVLTTPEDRDAPLLDAGALARALLGIGHVAVLPAAHTWSLTDRFGRVRSVFGGAVRAYMPGFDESSDPYAHRLFLAENLLKQDGAAQCDRWMRALAAGESVRRMKLGKDVLAFAPIRNASLELRQRSLRNEGATDAEQLAAADARIAALEKQAADDKATLEYFSSEHDKAELRAESAEQQLRAYGYRIRQLLDQLAVAGASPDAALTFPESWADFANWCDTQLSGRLTLTPAARRQVKSPAFEDVGQAARCLLWLATVCRDSRMGGGEGTLRDMPVEDGVRNAYCGGDQFDLDWQGQRFTADWHIKSGGNTHDPKRCLRIYYFWEPASQQIVVAEMPAHRRTDAT